MKYVWMLLFTAYVTIPFGRTVTYKNVERTQFFHEVTLLILTNGKTVSVPTMFTIIEEQ